MHVPAMTTRYRPHPAMELVVLGAVIFYGYIAVQETGPVRCAWHVFWFLIIFLIWLSMQRVAVSAEAVVVSRRFGLFPRRIPMGKIKDVVHHFVPGGNRPGGMVPELIILVAGERPCKVSLYSHGRHLRVLRHVRTLMARREDSAGGGDPPPSAP